MSGVLQALLAAAGGVVRTFTQWDMFATAAPGVLATASFTLNPDGTVSGLATPGDGGSSPGSVAWHLPITGGIGALYWCRFTVTSGTATSNGAAGWSQLNAARTITKGATTSTATCGFTFEIATDAAGANIVLTRAGNQVRYDHA